MDYGRLFRRIYRHEVLGDYDKERFVYCDACSKSWRQCSEIREGKLALMTSTFRRRGLDLLKARGICPGGKMTIGIGRNVDPEGGKGIDEEEASQLFVNDIVGIDMILARRIPFYMSLKKTRQEVLAEMAFQMGVEGLMGFTRTLAALDRLDFEAAADEMLDSQWHRQTPLRCEELSAIMRSGEADAGDDEASYMAADQDATEEGTT